MEAKKDFVETLDTLAKAATGLQSDDLRSETLHELIFCALDFELRQKPFASFFKSALKRAAARHTIL